MLVHVCLCVCLCVCMCTCMHVHVCVCAGVLLLWGRAIMRPGNWSLIPIWGEVRHSGLGSLASQPPTAPLSPPPAPAPTMNLHAQLSPSKALLRHWKTPSYAQCLLG